MNPHLLDVVFRGHWEVSAMDGEDNREAGSWHHYMTSFAVRKEGEWLAQVILGVWRPKNDPVA